MLAPAMASAALPVQRSKLILQVKGSSTGTLPVAVRSTTSEISPSSASGQGSSTVQSTTSIYILVLVGLAFSESSTMEPAEEKCRWQALFVSFRQIRY
jgi:hypothetical protein